MLILSPVFFSSENGHHSFARLLSAYIFIEYYFCLSLQAIQAGISGMHLFSKSFPPLYILIELADFYYFF